MPKKSANSKKKSSVYYAKKCRIKAKDFVKKLQKTGLCAVQSNRQGPIFRAPRSYRAIDKTLFFAHHEATA